MSDEVNEAWLSAIFSVGDPPRGKRKGDCKPLAALLRSGQVPPGTALDLLAELIDPTRPLFNFKLVPQRMRNDSFDKVNKQQRRRSLIYLSIRRKVGQGLPVEKAKESVAKELVLGLETVKAEWQAANDQGYGETLDRFFPGQANGKKSK
jgi:hypothetical protein